MAGNPSSKRASSSSSDQQQAKRRQRAPSDGVAGNAVAMPVVGVNGVALHCGSAAPLMLSPVTMQVQLLCYVAMPMVAATSSPPAAGGGCVPLAAALSSLSSHTLGRMVTELAQACTPPPLTRDRKIGATPPPWWPTAEEPWWGTEVAAHLRGRPMATPVPFASPRLLMKAEKVAVLVAVVKPVAPDFGRIAAAVSRSRLTELEASIWERALRSERERYVVMPLFILLPPQPPPPPPPQHVHSAESAAHSDPEPESADQIVDFSASGKDAARGGGSEDTVTTGPELEQLVGDGNGTAASAVEGQEQKPEETPVLQLEQEQHGGEDHDHHLHLHGDISGELSGAVAADVAAPEDVDWFDYDEVLRGLDELEIPSFFGGYYI